MYLFFLTQIGLTFFDSGSLLEPYLKIVRLMRSLEFEATADSPLIRAGRDLQSAIGQEPHKYPSVFSFFKPEFQPAGKNKLYLCTLSTAYFS